MIFTDRSFTFAITRVAARYRSALAHGMAAAGLAHITPDYRIVLECLWQEDNITLTQLAKRTHKDNASITRIVDGMERAALVQRVRNATDKRLSQVVLTPYASGLQELVGAIEGRLFQQATRGMNPIEARELERLLEQVFQSLR